MESFPTWNKLENGARRRFLGEGLGKFCRPKMSIKKWFSSKTHTTNNNTKRPEKVKQLSIFPTKPNTPCSSPEAESCNALVSDEQYQVAFVDGSDSTSSEQIAKEKSVRKFGLFGSWWRGNRNSNHVKYVEDTQPQQNGEQSENNQLLKDPTVLTFLESVDRRLNDRRLPLDKNDMVRLETFQAQAMADGCNELLDIIEYFEWENDRCLLTLRSAGPSKTLAAIACS